MSTKPRPARSGDAPKPPHARAVALFRGTPYAWPPSPECEAIGATVRQWRAVPLIEALQRRFYADTWFQGVVMARDRWPRLAKAVLLEPERVAAYGIGLGFVGLDLDRPGHEPWRRTEEADGAVMQAAARLDGAVVYATRAGLRAIWALAEPVPLALAQSFLDQLYGERLTPDLDAGLPVRIDRGARDWTRGYRLPWCPRQGPLPPWGSDRGPPMDLSAWTFGGRVLDWRPSRPLAPEDPRPATSFDWTGHVAASGDIESGIRRFVDRWAAEIAGATSRHEALLRKCRALGGLCAGHHVSPDPFVRALVEAAGDSHDRERTAISSLAHGAVEPWTLRTRIDSAPPPVEPDDPGPRASLAPSELPPPPEEPPGAAGAWMDAAHVSAAVAGWLEAPDPGPPTEMPMPGVGVEVGRAPALDASGAASALVPAPTRPAWRALHAILGPWRTGTLTVLVGPGGRGRSAFALQAAEAVARVGHPVLYVSVGMEADELVARLLAARALKTAEALAGARGAPMAWADLALRRVEAEGLRPSARMLVRDCPELYLWTPSPAQRSADALREAVREVSRRGDRRPPFVVIDDLQRWVGRSERGAELSEALLGLTRPAGGGACVLALSRLDGAHHPRLADVASLRQAWAGADAGGGAGRVDLVGLGEGTEAIERDASVVLLLAVDPPRGDGSNHLDALVVPVRVRHGSAGWGASMVFLPAAGVFADARSA